jgi:uncharacterized protein YcgL (UPF0745 family)
MSWKIAEAKQQFSEVLRRAAGKPQLIHNRDRLVGAVIGPEDTAAFLAWKAQQAALLSDAIDEVRRICTEEGYFLELPPRADRKNPLLRVADARRHQRP